MCLPSPNGYTFHIDVDMLHDSALYKFMIDIDNDIFFKFLTEIAGAAVFRKYIQLYSSRVIAE